MKIEQNRWTAAEGWKITPLGRMGESANLVLVFGSRMILTESKHIEEIKRAYPKAVLLGCSTSGEIFDTNVSDDSSVVTAVCFEHTAIKCARVKINAAENSFKAGAELAGSLDKTGLRHVFVLSDGLIVNGSELVKGLTENLPPSVTVTGGLSGDGDRFKETLVLCNGRVEKDCIGVLGFYGNSLKVGYGSLGGWDPFGPERLITRSEGNILYELDGRSALELYRSYLGDHAAGLPATGLLYPLCVRTKESQTPVVRTVLSIDEKKQSMTFAGDIPERAYARLMKANFDRLIDGAVGAAKTSYEAIGRSSPELAILISCVGRKMVLKQRIEEEVEGVRDVVGGQTVLTGFYSYGEISPFTPSAKCELHNQTMTITTLSER
jgi:hypothetical protein